MPPARCSPPPQGQNRNSLTYVGRESGEQVTQRGVLPAWFALVLDVLDRGSYTSYDPVLSLGTG